jgi:hypothetical protein
MKSKFHNYMFILIIALLALVPLAIIFSAAFISTLSNGFYNKESFILIFPLFIYFFLFLILREIRLKGNRIELTESLLKSTSLFGFGKSKEISLSNFSKITITTEPTKLTSGLTLNLYSNKKRTIEISDIFYSNFEELYECINNSDVDFKHEEYKFINTLKSIIGLPIPTPFK